MPAPRKYQTPEEKAEAKRQKDRRYRELMRQRRASDPIYNEYKKRLARESERRRIFSDAQRERRNERDRMRYHTKDKFNPRWKAEHNLRVRLKKFLHGHKSLTMRTLLGCSQDVLVSHLEGQFKRGMNWKNYGTAWHIDHIQPCASFDLTDTDEQRRCFHFSNLRPEWAKDNRSRGCAEITHQPELLISI